MDKNTDKVSVETNYTSCMPSRKRRAPLVHESSDLSNLTKDGMEG